MKTWPSLCLAAATMLGAVGCDQHVVQAPPPAQVADAGGVEVANTPPPAPEVDVQTPSPGADFVWIGGAWSWGGSGWAWEHGHWDRRPHPGAVWTPHRVEERGGHHVFVRGGWH